MKDNKRSIADPAEILAEDIEDVKKKLDVRDSSDRDGALKRLTVGLEPVIRFFNGNTPENVDDILGSKETIKEYKQSIGDEAVASLRLYTEANEGNMRKYGVPTIKKLLNKMLEVLTAHVEKDRQTSGRMRQKRNVISKLW